MKYYGFSPFDLWYAEANNDFEMGDILFNAGKYNGSVFYYIQVIEKAIKSLLYLFGERPWGHSIANLMQECETLGIEFPIDFKDGAEDLEQDYTGSRYPESSLGYAPKDECNEVNATIIKEKSNAFSGICKNRKGGS